MLPIISMSIPTDISGNAKCSADEWGPLQPSHHAEVNAPVVPSGSLRHCLHSRKIRKKKEKHAKRRPLRKAAASESLSSNPPKPLNPRNPKP